jgi:hypothetical protein
MKSALLIAVVPGTCALAAGFSFLLSRKDATDRIAANSLAVLSGTLAALAILIPLGTVFLPSGKFGWQAWILVGALIAAILCILANMFSMVQLQKSDKFKATEKLYVPLSINATWAGLILLSAGIVIAKSSISEPSANYSNSAPQLRFTVAHDLPELGISRDTIKQQWGTPVQEHKSVLLYRTNSGLAVFCLDAQGLAEAIIETKETIDNVSKSVCQPKPAN